ncbi:transcriptional regulator [Dinoroseobacter shibae DFL 12 = DSM 16493]|jgi:LysR family hydrogen peroxide-inducible transcriptional activator|uniref:Transcriptional regulator n=1 Tax=Dinoroseobacter shibae (strain DSM 16493 / NCIMB 14021 / DFL 12) TaxID=398580 RepID=A8LQS9_DINSH|nr:hydrogen peroxide-inducible genes activator [Dinoroseobacter shibae]ABV92472.1 transcriptional regulator [Dinoroseobacter shibae DFL 12 = DSM 16493]URF47416.1 hydrogen peroxide-inducible genes activator [Dinoroseobacter shibae]URF51727.1 hydrogen peroxide-inducible genes activator [Dinoroseobacter shibae]
MAGPTLRQLQFLVAIEETAHFRRAAERVGVTQPSLSAQIQNLEDTLGVALVERGRGGVRLTQVGREVVLRARRILDDVQSLVDFAGTARDGVVGTIRLGAKATLGPYLLPHVVGALHAAHPDLRIYIREDAPRLLEQDLARGEHDVILTQLPVTGADYTTARLFREPLLLALPADHPLLDKEVLRPRDLAGEQVLSLSPAYHLHDQITAICQQTGAQLARDYEGTSLDALRQMVGMGMGITFLPALYVRSEIEGRGAEVVVRRLSGAPIARSVGLVWRTRAGRTGANLQIAQVIRDVVRARWPELVVES